MDSFKPFYNRFFCPYIWGSNLLNLSQTGEVPAARLNSSSDLHFHSTSGLSTPQIRAHSQQHTSKDKCTSTQPRQKQTAALRNLCHIHRKKSQEENVILQLGLLTVSQSSINPPHLPQHHQEIAAKKGWRRKQNHL